MLINCKIKHSYLIYQLISESIDNLLFNLKKLLINFQINILFFILKAHFFNLLTDSRHIVNTPFILSFHLFYHLIYFI